MPLQLLLGIMRREGPVVECVGGDACGEVLSELLVACAVVDYFLRLEILYHLCYILVSALSAHELSCADVEQGDAEHPLAECYGAQEVVLFLVEDIVLHGNARSDYFRDASLDEFLRLLRVFELVADGYAAS